MPDVSQAEGERTERTWAVKTESSRWGKSVICRSCARCAGSRRVSSVSALRHYVESLGGELLITVRFADGLVEYRLGDDSPPSSR